MFSRDTNVTRYSNNVVVVCARRELARVVAWRTPAQKLARAKSDRAFSGGIGTLVWLTAGVGHFDGMPPVSRVWTRAVLTRTCRFAQVYRVV